MIQSGIYGYGLSDDAPSRVNFPLNSANRVFKTIKENFGTLVFARRYLDRLGVDRYVAGVSSNLRKLESQHADRLTAELPGGKWDPGSVPSAGRHCRVLLCPI